MEYFMVDVSPGGAYFKVKGDGPANQDTWYAYKVVGLGWGYADTFFQSQGQGQDFPNEDLLVLHKKHKNDSMNVICSHGDYIMISPNKSID